MFTYPLDPAFATLNFDHCSFVHYLERATIHLAYTLPYTIYHDTQNHINHLMAVIPSDWDAQVQTVRVICHTMRRLGDTNMSRNHWSIFLLLDGDKSVRLNMTADYGRIDGTSH